MPRIRKPRPKQAARKQTMSLDQFFKLLPRLKKNSKWLLTYPNGPIRANAGAFSMGSMCPVTAAAELCANKKFPPSQFIKAARLLGLSRDDAVDIASAADFAKHTPAYVHREKIRSRLLRGLGLNRRRKLQMIAEASEAVACE